MSEEKSFEVLVERMCSFTLRMEDALGRLETLMEKIKERDEETRHMATQAFEAFCGAQRLAEETAKRLLTPAIVEETLRSSLEKLHMKWIEEARRREMEEAAEDFLFNNEKPSRRWDA